MLSSAKVKIHGMQDDRWLIKDKITQYRGLIKLYERDREIYDADLARQKKQHMQDIRQLRKDVVVKREELGTAVYGDKQFLRNALQDHRRLQLAYMNSQADKVLECIHQENFNKRKQLDRIRYTKMRKMERFRQLQHEAAELKDRILYEVKGKLPTERKEQTVANYVQCANIKKNAALAIRGLYTKILDILKKSTGKCLMGATEMGQLAMEYLDDRKYEFSRLETEIKVNMKERERTLKIVRNEVQELTESFPNLIRKEENVNLEDLYEEPEESDFHTVQWELESITRTCKKLQRATLVSSFEDIIVRLREQRYQVGRLNTQLQINNIKRDALLNTSKHAILMLDTLKNVGQEETNAHLIRKKQLRADIEKEQTEEKALRIAVHVKGDIIIDIKTALQQLVYLLSTGGQNTRLKLTEAPPALQFAIEEMLQPVPEVESDFDKLILLAKNKLQQLLNALGKVDVSSTVVEAAEEYYHQVVSKAMMDNYKEDVALEGSLLEYEMEDPSVPNHDMVKKRSKQIVDSQVSEFDVVDAAAPSKKK